MLENDLLLDLLLGRSTIRRRILALVLADANRRYHLREVARRTGTSAGTASRELGRLVGAGLVAREAEGNQVYFRAGSESPILGALRGLIFAAEHAGDAADGDVPREPADVAVGADALPPSPSQTTVGAVPGRRRSPDPAGLGAARELRSRLEGIYGRRLRGVFLFGPRARGDARPGSAVDVLVVLDRVDREGDQFARAVGAAEDVAVEIAAPVNPVFVSGREWVTRTDALMWAIRRESVPV